LPWAQLRPWCAARPGPAPWCTSCGAALVPWCSSRQLRRALSHQLRRMRGPAGARPGAQLCSCAPGPVQLVPWCSSCPVPCVTSGVARAPRGPAVQLCPWCPGAPWSCVAGNRAQLARSHWARPPCPPP
jgi:hypothetical protein